jgi:WD40 repeat protein
LYIGVASDDGNIKIINDNTQKIEATLKGHEDAVLDILFDYNSKAIISSSADFSFRVWS